MSAPQLHIHEYALRMKPGVRFGYSALETREGIVLRLASGEREHAGFGEAAPAWWVGDEPVRTAHEALVAAAAWFSRTQPDPLALEAELRGGAALPKGLADTLAASRSAQAAVATALADHQARVRGVALAEYLGGRTRPCATNALVVAHDEGGVAADIKRALADGYRSAKLKVGGTSAEADIARIRSALVAGHNRITLRLDANCGWDDDTATAVLSQFSASEIEYIEEPLATPTPEAFKTLHARCGVPLALDETVQSADDIDRFTGAADVVVLKPARSRGPWSLLRTAERATAAGMDVTLTDSLESAVGRATCLHLALAIGNSSRPTGLAGAALLAEDMTANEDCMRGATILPRGPGLLPIEELKSEVTS